MKKSLHWRMLTGMLLMAVSMACGLIPFAQIDQTETEAPLSTLTPKITKTPVSTVTPDSTATLVPAPTEYVPPSPAPPKFAPFCQPSSASIATPMVCQEPIAEQSSSYCSRKTPYNTILINPGSTYETLNEAVTCKEAGENNGKQVLICTGPMVTPFELQVCDPSCAIQPFPAGTTECPQDLRYNDLLRCCEREPIPVDGNCVTLKLQTRSCVIECGEFIDQTTCEKNAYACKWDREKKICFRKR